MTSLAQNTNKYGLGFSLMIVTIGGRRYGIWNSSDKRNEQFPFHSLGIQIV